MRLARRQAITYRRLPALRSIMLNCVICRPCRLAGARRSWQARLSCPSIDLRPAASNTRQHRCPTQIALSIGERGPQVVLRAVRPLASQPPARRKERRGRPGAPLRQLGSPTLGPCRPFLRGTRPSTSRSWSSQGTRRHRDANTSARAGMYALLCFRANHSFHRALDAFAYSCCGLASRSHALGGGPSYQEAEILESRTESTTKNKSTGSLAW